MERLKELMTARQTINVALQDVTNGRFEVQQILVRRNDGCSNSNESYDFDVILKQLIAEQAQQIVTNEVRLLQPVNPKGVGKRAAKRQCVEKKTICEAVGEKAEMVPATGLSSILKTITSGAVQDIGEGIPTLACSFNDLETGSSTKYNTDNECDNADQGTNEMVTIATIHYDSLMSEGAIKPDSIATKEDKMNIAKMSGTEVSENVDSIITTNSDIEDNNSKISSEDNHSAGSPHNPDDDGIDHEDYTESCYDNPDRENEWESPLIQTAKRGDQLSNFTSISNSSTLKQGTADISKSRESIESDYDDSNGDRDRQLSSTQCTKGAQPLSYNATSPNETLKQAPVSFNTAKENNSDAEISIQASGDKPGSEYVLSPWPCRRGSGPNCSSVEFHNYSCFLCPDGNLFRSWDHLGTHILKEHSSRESDGRFRIDCVDKLCEKNFYLTSEKDKKTPADSLFNLRKRLGNVLTHFNVRHKMEFPKSVKVFSCPVVECTFCHVIAAEVKKHQRNVHLGVNKVTCDQCGTTVNSKKWLEKHKIKGCTGKHPAQTISKHLNTAWKDMTIAEGRRDQGRCYQGNSASAYYKAKDNNKDFAQAEETLDSGGKNFVITADTKRLSDVKVVSSFIGKLKQGSDDRMDDVDCENSSSNHLDTDSDCHQQQASSTKQIEPILNIPSSHTSTVKQDTGESVDYVDWVESDFDDSDRDPDWQPQHAQSNRGAHQLSNITSRSLGTLKQGPVSVSKEGKISSDRNVCQQASGDKPGSEYVLSPWPSRRGSGPNCSTLEFHNYSCFFCPDGNLFKSWNHLGGHILKEHCSRESDGRFRIDCVEELCDKNFYLTSQNDKKTPADSLFNLRKKLGNVLNHFNVKHMIEYPKGVKVFTCPVVGCSYCHVIPAEVKTHQRNVHLGVNKVTCDQCGTTVHSKKCLEKHKIKACTRKPPAQKISKELETRTTSTFEDNRPEHGGCVEVSSTAKGRENSADTTQIDITLNAGSETHVIPSDTSKHSAPVIGDGSATGTSGSQNGQTKDGDTALVDQKQGFCNKPCNSQIPWSSIRYKGPASYNLVFHNYKCFLCSDNTLFRSWKHLGSHILKAHCIRARDGRLRMNCVDKLCNKAFHLTYTNDKTTPANSLTNLRKRLGEILNHFRCRHKRKFPKSVKVFSCSEAGCHYSHVIAALVKRHEKRRHLKLYRVACDKCGDTMHSKSALTKHKIEQCPRKRSTYMSKDFNTTWTVRRNDDYRLEHSRQDKDSSTSTYHGRKADNADLGSIQTEMMLNSGSETDSIDINLKEVCSLLPEATELTPSNQGRMMEEVETSQVDKDIYGCSGGTETTVMNQNHPTQQKEDFEEGFVNKGGEEGSVVAQAADCNSPDLWWTESKLPARLKFYSKSFKEHKCFLCPSEPAFIGHLGLARHVFKNHCSAGPEGYWQIKCGRENCKQFLQFKREKLSPFYNPRDLVGKLPFTLQHLYRVHGFAIPDYVKVYHCSAEGCNYQHTLPTMIKEHFKNRHVEKVMTPCDKCGVLISEGGLIKHQKTHCTASEDYHDPKLRLQCPHCDKTYKHSSGLYTHVKIIHENRAACYICEICSHSTRDTRALEQHMFKDHNYNPKEYPILKCELCDYRAVWDRALQVHVRRTHNKPGKTCEECGLVFIGWTFRMHKETHSSKTYQCSQCSYSTKHKLYFGRHTNAQHKKSRAFPCKYCPYKSGYMENTLKHMKSCAKKHGVSSN